MSKYISKSKHSLKCFVCGSKEFDEIYIENATSRLCITQFGMADDGNHKHDAWLYICTVCGYVLPFTDKAQLNESFAGRSLSVFSD